MYNNRERIADYTYYHKYLLVFTIIFYGFESKLAQLSVQDPVQSDVASECIVNILHKYFSESKKIAISYAYDQRQQTIVEQLSRYTNNPITINSNEYPKGMEIDHRRPNDAAILLNEYMNITAYLESNLYTADTVFFMVVWEQRQEIGRMFREFWNYNVIETFILEVLNDKIYVHEYFPYVNCKLGEPMLLDTWSDGDFRYGRINRVGDRVTITDLKGCHFNVSVVNIPPTIIFPSEDSVHGSYMIDGVEGRILMTVADKLNCNLTYKTPDDGQKWGFITPEPAGAVGDVHYKKSLLACGLHTPNVERFSYLDSVVSSSGVVECIALMVPTGAAKRVPIWVGVFVTEFSPLTWFCVIMVLTMSVFCFTIFARILSTSVSVINSCLFLFPSSIGVSMKKPRTMTLKTLFLAWIWYGLLTRTAYESAVKTRLTVPLRYKDIDTFQELVEAELELYGLSNTIRVVLAGNENPDMRQLGRILKATNKTISEVVEKILEDRKTGYLREYTTFFYNAYKNRNAIGEIHRVKQCALEYYPTMYLQKRSPATPLVRRIVSRLFESGILLWWRSLFIRHGSDSQIKLIQLSIKHMATPFFAYFCGVSISAIVFAAERVRYNYYIPKIRVDVT